MECNLIVSPAAFGPIDQGSNLAGLLSQIQIENCVFTNNRSLWYSSKYCNPARGGGAPLQVVIHSHLSFSIDGVVHQNEEIWSCSLWKD